MKLRVLTGDMDGYEFDVDGGVVTLGRKAENDVVLPLDSRISRFHAQLSHGEGDAWLLEDLDSTNGTFVGRRRIHAPTPIKPGEAFRMGRTWLRLEEEPSPQVNAADAVVLVEEEPEGQRDQDIVVSVQPGMEAERELDANELARRLEVMRDVGAALGSTLELSELLEELLRSIMRVVPAERAFLLLRDSETGELEPRAVWPLDDRSGRLAISRSIIERAMDQQSTLLLSDAMADERFGEVESVRDLRIRSAISAPLLRAGEALGVIFLEATSATHVFDRGDAEMVSSIASQAAVAIENARLYTELKAAYEELKTAQEQMVRTEKLSIIGTLSASVAHDMANVVSPMVTLVDLALDRGEVDESTERSLERQLQRLLALVERLKSFARPERMEMEPTDVNDVVAGALSMIRTELQHEDVKMDLQLAEDLPKIQAAATQLDRVMLNVCLNALEAMEEEPKVLTIATELDGDEVAISVTDTGPGIPPEVQARLFEPFFTTKEAGTGMGLFSCRRIVEDEHGGSIELDSRVGEGTTVTVRLPVNAAQ
ncbi:MAG: ATP-binding protein [Armatimonadota bacterium]|nr:ATP-binding protein [Armatimonadota bacterium]